MSEVDGPDGAATGFLAAIVVSSEDAIIGKTLDGTVTSWNRAAERIFGYTGAEMMGQPIALLAAPGKANEMPGILDGIRRRDRIDHYETARRRKDGRIIEIALTVSPIRDKTGRIVGASKIARDISETKRTTAAWPKGMRCCSRSSTPCPTR
jgi:PAS domain S-box-containing protein